MRIAFLSILFASAAFGACNEHAFDFWAGDFDARPWAQPDAPIRGHLHNTLEYDGCVIVEHWDGKQSTGMSMSFYDTNRHAWRMVWIGNDGLSNDFEGSYHDGTMQFDGWVLDPSGKRLLARNTLQKVSATTVRHIYSESPDNGKTWVVKSDGRFERVKK